MSLILRGLLFGSLCLMTTSAGAQSAPDLASSSIEDLQILAKKGHKPAQLELGKKLEAQGELDAALGWYEKAGRAEKLRRYVYSPPVGNERYGRTLSVGPRAVVPGIEEARLRAERVREKLKEVSK